MKKHFDKELVMTNEDDEYFENSTKCWICDNAYVKSTIKTRCHCHITEKHRCSAHRAFISTLNQIIKSCCIPQPKKLRFPSYYARTRKMQF